MDDLRERGTALRECDLARGSGRDGDGRCVTCGDLLPARRVRYCSDQCGRADADQHVWDQARQVALERDGFRCVRCGAEDVEVHHVLALPDRSWYRRRSCAHHVAGLLTLCRSCHVEEHRFARQVAVTLDWACGTKAEQMRLPLVEPSAA